MTPQRTFGSAIRAARLGYHWHEHLQRYVRISDTGSGCWLIDVRLANHLPSKASGEHRRWWDDPVLLTPAILELCPRLREVMVADPCPGVQFTVNDDGEVPST